MTMLDLFLDILKGPCSLNRGDSVLVCCSGGVDSMVLLDLMDKAARPMGLRIGVVHIDHGIRGDESHHDARFVIEQCERMHIDSYVYELDISPETPNLEEEARIRRYEAIMKCAREHGYTFVATGHTMDDQAETIIYRFIRGSGIRGLAGMDYTTKDGLLRPLLGFSRREIEHYAAAGGISHVNDRTNEDTKLVRNRIRHELLPLMRKINPSVVNAVSRLSDIAREEGNALADLAQSLEERAVVFNWDLVRAYKSDILLDAGEALARRLIIAVLTDMLGEPRGVDAIQIQGIMDVLTGLKRAHTIKRRVHAELDDNMLVFSTTLKGPFFDVAVEGPGIHTLEGINQKIEIRVPRQDLPLLRVRSYIPGDRIGTKKVSRILSEGGVARTLRVFWPVVLLKDEVVCVAGMKGSCRDMDIQTEFPYHE